MRISDWSSDVCSSDLLVSEHDAARMDPFCMLDAAAIGPVAADHVSTVHRAREPSRNAVSGDHYIGVLGENFTDRVTGGIKRHGRRQRVVHHCAQARGPMGPGEELEN